MLNNLLCQVNLAKELFDSLSEHKPSADLVDKVILIDFERFHNLYIVIYMDKVEICLSKDKQDFEVFQTFTIHTKYSEILNAINLLIN